MQVPRRLLKTHDMDRHRESGADLLVRRGRRFWRGLELLIGLTSRLPRMPLSGLAGLRRVAGGQDEGKDEDGGDACPELDAARAELDAL